MISCGATDVYCAWNLYLVHLSVIYERHKCLIRGEIHSFNFVKWDSDLER